MTSDQKTNKASLAARFKKVLAGLALAGILAGGASAVVDVEPVSSEDTTETARMSLMVKADSSWAYSRGVSWQ